MLCLGRNNGRYQLLGNTVQLTKYCSCCAAEYLSRVSFGTDSAPNTLVT